MLGWDCFSCPCCQHMLQRLSACPFMSCLLLLLASLMALKIILKIACCLCKLMKHMFKQKNLAEYGEWAVITGASDGIGKAIAIQLAKKGIKKFLLIARNEQKLKDAATELELVAPSAVTVSRLVVDFAAETPEKIFSKVSAAVEGLSVGILVNNVGISYPHAMYYDEVPLSLLEELIKVNVTSTLVVTRAIMPGMKARKSGLIVCMGSGASELPSDPLYAAYAATKASAEAFCRSLKVEASPFGISVQCQVPLLVTTKLSKCKTPGLMKPSANSYAASAVSAMACAGPCSKSTVSPNHVHAFVLGLANFMPRCWWSKIRMGQSVSIRQRALKKQEGQKKDS